MHVLDLLHFGLLAMPSHLEMSSHSSEEAQTILHLLDLKMFPKITIYCGFSISLLHQHQPLLFQAHQQKGHNSIHILYSHSCKQVLFIQLSVPGLGAVAGFNKEDSMTLQVLQLFIWLEDVQDFVELQFQERDMVKRRIERLEEIRVRIEDIA